MAELNLDKTETALLMADQRKPWTSWVTQSLSGLLRLRWWHWGRPKVVWLECQKLPVEGKARHRRFVRQCLKWLLFSIYPVVKQAVPHYQIGSSLGKVHSPVLSV